MQLPSVPFPFDIALLINAKFDVPVQLSQDFQLHTFRVGDELFVYEENFRDPIPSHGLGAGLYVMCQGHGRILSAGSELIGEIPVQSLGPGDTFGAESLLEPHEFPYRVVAASNVDIAWMPLAVLQRWIDQLPDLKTYLQAQIKYREKLIFFKTMTSLKSCSSYELQDFILACGEQHLQGQQPLTELVGANHFWLRHGIIQSTSPDSYPPLVGEDWGYPDPIPPEWFAQRALSVYSLHQRDWSRFPFLQSAPAESSLKRWNADASDNLLRGDRSRPSPPQHPFTLTRSTQVAAPNPPSPNPLTFPRPSHRRGRRIWRGVPFIEQQSAADCGVACVAMIARYWGKQLSLNTLRELAGTSREGTSLKGLVKAAEKVGFEARPVRASLDRMADSQRPFVAHWQGDHFVVVYKIRHKQVLIADPAKGRRWLSHQDFLAGWTGYALLLDPTKQLQTTTSEDNQSLNNLLGLLWPYRSLIIQIILASLLIQIFGLVTPLLTQVILDRVVVQRSVVTLNVFAIGLLIFGLWQVGLAAVRQYLLDYFSNRLDLSLLSGFVKHTLKLPLKFFDFRHVGDITTRVDEGQKIQLFLTRQLVIVWLDVVMMIVYIGLMAYYNWHLTLLVLAFIPLIALLAIGATPLLRQVSREIFNADAKENSTLVEMMAGIATIKAVAVEQEVRWRWENDLIQLLNARFHGQKLANTLQASSGVINSLGSTALIWYGAYLVIQDQLTIGQFFAFNMLIGSVIGPVLALVGLWDEFQEVTISVERLNDIFSAKPEEPVQHSMLYLPSIQGKICFDNVTFRYGEEDEQNTLQNVSFEVQSGETIAIVGRSGSGKTTLISLLQGLYHPSSGRILIDGHEIRHISPHSLRSQLGVVPQECFLFSGTILENITLHRPDYGLEQVVAVAKLAEAHAFIQALPLGYNTKVGERGSTLSGGQRQRIAIARALLGQPGLLILDEATSSLDTESERRFQHNLAQISHNRTSFIIAHRLSTVRQVDRIFVLDQGILVEQGNHEELMAKEGLYYYLAQQQLAL
ncbi:peptidase domain-containing ABC transporter [Leptothoe sp. PORK10 BA2]|uniref:peptidase domain-containing ABC transporter n=1 Tax=Leptothoe sp. PORK10 BA2 TaxID=3110254 RepID=UPI002B1F92A9|nr:peptidase domain-containing ABC transporter [Leptothoe sp. PORK10 BA2]MEA5466589.1 peptidase domain-containing ABC transporter [Leptothoe sp. PORK10 BA2]